MTMLSPEARDVVTAARPAHLVTINADGSPQVSIVWVGLDGDEIVSGHLGMRQKLRNVERDVAPQDPSVPRSSSGPRQRVRWGATLHCARHARGSNGSPT
jgi:hypothetical protein